jgi:hypothetical protein
MFGKKNLLNNAKARWPKAPEIFINRGGNPTAIK